MNLRALKGNSVLIMYLTFFVLLLLMSAKQVSAFGDAADKMCLGNYIEGKPYSYTEPKTGKRGIIGKKCSDTGVTGECIKIGKCDGKTCGGQPCKKTEDQGGKPPEMPKMPEPPPGGGGGSAGTPTTSEQRIPESGSIHTCLLFPNEEGCERKTQPATTTATSTATSSYMQRLNALVHIEVSSEMKSGSASIPRDSQPSVATILRDSVSQLFAPVFGGTAVQNQDSVATQNTTLPPVRSGVTGFTSNDMSGGVAHTPTSILSFLGDALRGLLTSLQKLTQ